MGASPTEGAMSSVPRSRRPQSGMAFFQVAKDLRKYLTLRLLKDLGIKPRIRTENIRVDTSGLSEEARQTLASLLSQCGTMVAEDIYPKWFIKLERRRLVEIMQDMMGHIVAGNKIYASTEALLAQRVSHQQEAICACNMLYQELEFLVAVLPSVQAEKLRDFLAMCERERALLIGWKKSSKLIKQAGGCKRSVANSDNFCNANDNGNANNNGASDVNGARPISGLPQASEPGLMPEERSAHAL